MRSPLARIIIPKTLKMVSETKKQARQRESIVIPINDEQAVLTACRCLREGHVIALPTDTIYGLAASVQNNDAIIQMYNIKHRDINNPLAICVGNITDIALWGETSHLPYGLLESLLPGAVTVVLKRKSNLNPRLNPNCSLVGIRIPAYRFINEVSTSMGMPLALTSANISTRTSPLNINEFSTLWPSLAAVFDGGALAGSRDGSTVIDLSQQGSYWVKRKGSAYDLTINILNKFGLLERS